MFVIQLRMTRRIYSSICAPSSSQSEPIAIWSSGKKKRKEKIGKD